MAEKRKHTADREPKAAPVQCFLRAMMPVAGMTYRSPERLLHNINRELRVSNAVEASGFRLTYEYVTHVFSEMFRAAVPMVSTAHSQGLSLWDALPWVQHDVAWAADLPAAIFFELFTCLVEARHEWLKNPAPYPSRHSNDWLAVQIDEFRKRVGDCPADMSKDGSGYGDPVSWILLDAAFFNDLARGLYQDEDEDEDVEMRDAGGDGDDGDKDGDEFVPYEDKASAQVVPPMKRMRIKQQGEA